MTSPHRISVRNEVHCRDEPSVPKYINRLGIHILYRVKIYAFVLRIWKAIRLFCNIEQIFPFSISDRTATEAADGAARLEVNYTAHGNCMRFVWSNWRMFWVERNQFGAEFHYFNDNSCGLKDLDTQLSNTILYHLRVKC